jgi:hypothetical protein
MMINRRIFLRDTTLAAIFGVSGLRAGQTSENQTNLIECRTRTLTRGPKHHFFGYYGICPWNKSGRHLVCLESAFQDRMPEPNETAAIGLVDSQTGRFTEVTRTQAWNLQQGAMLHWNPLNPENEIIYNDLEDNEVVSVIFNVESGKKHVLPRAVSAVSHNGKWALSLTYGRMGRLRKVVGYGGAKDPNPDNPAPDNDGVFLMDLTTAKCQLAVSIARVYEQLLKKYPLLQDRHMWFNHTVFNKSDNRFFFLARANLPPDDRRYTAMFTANLDGSDLREAIAFDKGVSHFDWRNDKEIIATFSIDGPGRKHVLFTDGRTDYKIVGDGFLDSDGHCSFSPDGNWLITDRKNGRTMEQSLLVYNVNTKYKQVLCTYDMREKKYMSGDTRCDFHPRWSRSGDMICFDAIEPAGGTRQVHIAYLKGI